MGSEVILGLVPASVFKTSQKYVAIHTSNFIISKVFSKTYSEPIDELYYGDGAHAKTKSANASNAGEKVKPCHLSNSKKILLSALKSIF